MCMKYECVCNKMYSVTVLVFKVMLQNALTIFLQIPLAALMNQNAATAAVLTVQPFLFPSEVIKGQSVTVLCAVLDGGSGPFLFRWTKDGSQLHDQKLTRIQTSEEFSLLSLKSLDRKHTGNYTCTVSSDVDNGQYTAELLVNEQPEWLVMPVDLSVVLGQNARIDCKATGAPEPSIVWKKLNGDGRNVPPLSGNGHHHHLLLLLQQSMSANGSLLINKARTEDAGKYLCAATNGIGEGLTKTVTVRVHVSPEFREEFQLIRVRSSHSIALPCEVTGDPPISVKWSKEYLTDDSEPRHDIQETPLPNGLLSELYITRTARTDAGIYTCTATNQYGQRQRVVKLVVLEPPSPPSDIAVKQIGSEEVTIRWTAAYSGNSPVTRYVLQYWKDTGAPPKLEEETSPSDQTSAVLKGLHPGTPYVLRLVAENEFGQSAPSIPVKFTTAEENPSGYPTDLIVVPNGPNALLVRWKAPPPEQQNGFIQGYDLGYRERRTSEPYAYQETPHIKQAEEGYQEYVLDKLEAGTEYEVVVRAYNRAGRGPISVPITSRTRNKGFLAIPQVWVEGTTATSISLRWTNGGSKAKSFHFKLRYRVEDDVWQEVVIPNREQESYVLSNLRESTTYEISIQAVSGLDHSQPSAILKVSTSDPSSMRSSMQKEDDLGQATMHTANPSTATLVISLSVVTSAVVIVCVIAAACVYVVRIRSRNNYKTEENGSRGLSEQRSVSELARMSQSANFRYVDVNSRPLLWCSTPAPPPLNEYPSPYATLPLRHTPLSKRWQSEGDGLSPAHSERSESLVNQRLDQGEEKTPSCHD